MLSKEKIHAVARNLSHARYYLRASREMWLNAEDEAVKQSWGRKYKRDIGVLQGMEEILSIVVDVDSDDWKEISRVSKQKLARMIAEEEA